MAHHTPRDGDSTSDWRNRGYYVGYDGTLRTPWGHRIRGWHGPVTSEGGTVRDRP